MMEGFGAPEASINEALTKLENQNQFGIAGILKSLVICSYSALLFSVTISDIQYPLSYIFYPIDSVCC